MTDGICNATVPIEWVDTGNGRGLTVERGPTQARRSSPDSEITQTDDSIRITYPGDSGLIYRGRFDTIYCDFSLTTTGRALSDDERVGFEAAVASLGPA